ncbi:type II secretion system F family protein [Pseudonocardia sp. K10HN5]|uniref:Type II secretion system F family protein n=2 Tax=Pseudonocardia acidicola TaxID=2724939 RepID=A0ABX1SC90_9PSEU|nr:type II secretion system F family protein [Pseudonocardia acidicola]
MIPDRSAPFTAMAAVLLAGALLACGGRAGSGRLRTLTAGAAPAPTGEAAPLRASWTVTAGLAVAVLVWAAVGGTGGALLGATAGSGAGIAARRMVARSRGHDGDGAGLAGGWELLAVCLEAGLPVPVAVQAAAERLAGRAGVELRRVAGLLELGADPAEAWRGVDSLPALRPFGRAARRSAVTGAALAQVARSEAVRLRAELVDTAQARAQRAAVQITGPLGLCFLPAFLALGIAPVVIGLAGDAVAQW